MYVPLTPSVTTETPEIVTTTDEPVEVVPMMLPFGPVDDIVPDTTTPPNRNLPGGIGYSLRVDDYGRVSLDVPIDAFVSEFELGHGLALQYRGDGRPGALGRGWRMGGFPVISRGNRNFFTDGNTSGPRADTSDVWTLDGERLIEANRADGVTTFYTQTRRVRVCLRSGIFTAYMPDGARWEFGASDGFNRYPTLMTAADGQRVSFIYDRSRKPCLLQRVDYGDERSVHLKYRLATVPRFLYSAGTGMLYREKLDSVVVCRQGRVLARYALGYADRSVDSPLTSVVRLDSMGNAYPAFRVGYRGSGAGISTRAKRLQRYFRTDSVGLLAVTRGRFDYGCESDGLVMHVARDPYKIINQDQYGAKTYASGFKDTDTILVSSSPDICDSVMFCSPIPADTGFVALLAVDVDSLPGDEPVRVNNRLIGTNDHVKFTVFRQSYGNLGFYPVRDFEFNLPSINTIFGRSIRPKRFFTGDFDGDGKDEILMVTCSSASYLTEHGSATLIDPSMGAIKGSFPIDSCHWECPFEGESSADLQTDFNNSDRLLPIDIDGDGKQELAIVGAGGMRLYRFGFDASGALSMSLDRAGISLTLDSLANQDLRVGDFNGDGNADLLRYCVLRSSDNRYFAHFRRYTGNGLGQFSSAGGYYCPISGPDVRLVLADSDRDGATDILFHSTSTTGGNHTEYVHKFSDSQIVENGTLHIAPNTVVVPACSSSAAAGGTGTLMSLDGGGNIRLFDYTHPADIGLCVTDVSDGSGNVHRFTYGRVFYHSGMPFETGRYRFPYAAYGAGKPVCVNHLHIHADPTVSYFSPRDTIADITYRYANPAIHRQGLGFMGFETVTAVDNISRQKVIHRFRPDSLGTPRGIEVFNNSTTLNAQQYTHSITVDSLRRIHIHRTGEQSTDFATAVTSNTSFTYDSDDNLLSRVTTFNDGSQTAQQFQWLHIGNDTIWMPGLIQSASTTVSLPGKPSHTTGTTTEYNTHYLPSTVTQWVGAPANATATRRFSYDSSKRMVTASLQPFNGHERKRYYIYSTEKRNPVGISDERGILTQMRWGDFGLTATAQLPDPECHDTDPISEDEPIGTRSTNGTRNLDDTPLEFFDPNSIITRYHYDNMGRCDSVTEPSGAGTRTLWSWADTNDFGASLLTETLSDAQPHSRQWTDPDGRVVITATMRFSGKWLVSRRQYDRRGRIAAISHPSWSNTMLWDTYNYDNYDRPTAKHYPDGHSDTWTYNGLRTTTTRDGITKSRLLNPLGMLIEAQDAGGTINYDPRSDGQPDTINAHGNILTSFAYDNFGRQVTINDPSAGIRQTTYDSAGNIATRSDARPACVSNTYNPLGQLTSRQLSGGPSGTFTYNIWGNPTSFATDNGHTKSWTYDRLQRPAKEDIDGFQRLFTYDSIGQPATTTYRLHDTDIATERYHYTNGTLTAITLDQTGDTIFALLKENTAGKTSRLRLGHLTSNLTSYDTRQQHPQQRTTSHDNGQTIQDQGFSYDPQRGNLTLREDLLNDICETFIYDNLNRLTSDELYHYTYDNHGNITARSDVGQFSYAQARPYAFNEIENPSTLIPLREQYISYNALSLPDTITEASDTATFTYHADGSRATMTLRRDSTRTETRHYYGDRLTTFERADSAGTQTKSVLLLGGTAYDAPAALVKDYGSDRWKLLHILRDNLGSITHLVDSAGNVVQELSYTPWGQLRDPETLRPYLPDNQPDLLLDRGFTGHEHLTTFGLINMNARLYDPAAGRFLNPDPVIQAPDNTQNLNRYTYCLNNPLRYADESGMNYYVLNPDDWHYLNVLQSEDMGVYLPEVVVSSSGRNRPFGVNELMLFTTSNRYCPIFIPYPGAQFDTPDNYNNYQGGGSGNSNSPQSDYGGQISSVITIAENTLRYGNVTYAVHYNNNYVNVKFYTNGWRGNQYVWTRPLSRFAPVLKFTGIVVTGYTLYNDFQALQHTIDPTEKIDKSVDFVISCLTLYPNPYVAIPAAIWGLGGNEVFYNWRDNIVIPNVHTDYFGDMSNHPFK